MCVNNEYHRGIHGAKCLPRIPPSPKHGDSSQVQIPLGSFFSLVVGRKCTPFKGLFCLSRLSGRCSWLCGVKANQRGASLSNVAWKFPGPVALKAALPGSEARLHIHSLSLLSQSLITHEHFFCLKGFFLFFSSFLDICLASGP